MTRSRLYKVYDKALMWLVLAFFAAHILNHLAIYAGAQAHIAVMDTLRVIYRMPLIELILIWAITRQAWAGIKQSRRFGPLKSKGRFRMLSWSGLYLIGFLLIHIGAITVARYIQGLDTNIYFGAAGYRVWPFMYWFYPYYFLAIFLAFSHAGAVLWLRTRAKNAKKADRFYKAGIILGLTFGVLITLGVSGTSVAYDIPSLYTDSFR